MQEKLLTQRKNYLAYGVYIGGKNVTRDMRDFVYKIKPDGLAILNVRKIDKRIRVAAKFLARHKNILIASRKKFTKNMVEKFGEMIGAKVSTGRFLPGTLTNPKSENYYEAEVLLIIDPEADKRALEEAVKARVPVVAISNSTIEVKNVDLIIPANNRSKKPLGLVFYLLSREILKERGVIKSYEEFKYTPEDFII
ncbi:MAG: 30S ribosomal protein S2 [Candidatus Aenigmarchaeota archaeon]|nr:30S ribosomal protein S2 [Candidatus Aenigmarchaeota archaeon]MCX8191110.1 30S ribosomal protein S2 [Candidatus Aenigmarchaeota archaeon]MDW8160334.1 30S ribosomal protein S2 [Candidatus Aenigmarchaeota archaeon]